MRERALNTVSDPDGGSPNSSGRRGGVLRSRRNHLRRENPPLPAERHLRQQRDHLQRPAQIAEIMHFPLRPDLSDGAAIRTLMHAVPTAVSR